MFIALFLSYFKKTNGLKEARTSFNRKKKLTFKPKLVLGLFFVVAIIIAGTIYYSSGIFAAPLDVSSGTITLLNSDNGGQDVYDYDSITVSNGAELVIQGGITVNVTGAVAVTGAGSKITIEGKNTDQSAGGVGVTINAASADIDSGTSLDASNSGYQGGAVMSSGDGDGPGQFGSTMGGGGGHGGIGATGKNGGLDAGAGGSSYGVVDAPDSLGSGGGGGNSYTGGNGGGAIKLNISGTLSVDGSISANGQDGTGSAGTTDHSGGGAGGSIWIIADTVNGGGSISARGGEGHLYDASNYGGDGAGGRMMFEVNTWSASLSSISVVGGSGNNAGATGTVRGLSPMSAISFPSEGERFNYAVTTTGTAASVVGSLTRVEALLRNNSIGLCWIYTSTWTWGTCPSDTGDWPDATGTANWTYSGPTISSYTNNHNYTLRTKAYDNSVYSPEIPAVTGVNFTFDNQNPSGSVSYSFSHPVRDTDTLRITATYNEAMRTTPAPQIDINFAGSGSDLVDVGMTQLDSTHFYYDVDVPSGNDGTAVVTITGGLDIAGNAAPQLNGSFLVDNTAPTTTVDIVSDSYTNATWVDIGTIAGTASDTNAINSIDVSIRREDGAVDHWWDGADWNSESETWVAVTEPNNSWTYFLDDLNLGNGFDYTVKARATDVSGNMTSVGLGEDTFHFDQLPQVTAVTLSDPSPTQAGTVIFTVDFHEAMDTATDPTITIGTVAPYDAHIIGDSPSWTDADTFTVQVTIPSDGSWDGNNTIKISGAKDLLGNTMFDDTTQHFVIDASAPVILSIDSPASNGVDPSYYSEGGYVSVCINFSEPISTVGPLTFTLETGDVDKSFAYNFSGIEIFCLPYLVSAGELSDDLDMLSIVGVAYDSAGNGMVNFEPGVSLAENESIVIDTEDPVSSVVYPSDGFETYNLTNISGVASDNTFLDNVRISLRNVTEGAPDEDKYWNPGTSQWMEGSEILIPTAQNPDWEHWTYTTPVDWEVDNYYLICSRATDVAANLETAAGCHTFKFINEAPVVSNVTASQDAQGLVNVTYDVYDNQVDITAGSLFYDSGTTLAAAIPNGSSTANIQVNDASRFPNSGTILIKFNNVSGDRFEYIQYSGKSGNALTGIVRAREGTVGYPHSIGEQIWAKAVSVTGDVGPNIPDGTGKSITWTAVTDTAFYESNMRIMVASHDGASSNNVGVNISPQFVFDTADPVVISRKIDASVIPAQLTLDVTDDTALEMMISLNEDFSGAAWEAYSDDPTITLASNPDIVYLKFRDIKSNEIVAQPIVTPNTPGSLMAQDISSATQDKWRMFLSWQIISAPEPGFDSYRIYRSSVFDGVYTNVGATTADNISIDNYTDTLNENDAYCYKLASRDDNGNISFLGSYRCTVANGTQDIDEGDGNDTDPVITVGPTADPAADSATITWETNEIADSYVEFGETASYGSIYGLADLVTNHSIVLPAVLLPNTQYHYRIRTRDLGGNLTISEDGTFTTLIGGDTDEPVISVVSSGSLTTTSATITWTTDENASSIVDYGTDTSYGSTAGNSADSVTAHSVVLSNLLPDTAYIFRVRSTDTADNEAIDDNSGSGYTFSTVVSPTISNVSSLATDDTVTIDYTTSPAAYGFVDYGLDASYGTVIGNEASADTTHQIFISSLTPGTTYHYRPRIRDIYGNYTYDSQDRTFTTNSQDAPMLQSFISSTANGTYGPSANINVSATYSENLATGSTIIVALNSGATVTLSAITDDELSGTYTVGATGSGENAADLAVATIVYQNACDSDGNCNHTVNIPATNINTDSDITVDTSAPQFTSLLPVSSSTINSVETDSDISYSLNETMTAGAITITRTGGTTDDNSPHVCTLTGTHLQSGEHSNFNTANCNEGVRNLVNGAIYTFNYSGQDAVGNSTTIDRTNITYNATALTLDSFSSTTVDGTYGPGDTIDIMADYSENLASGSITITLNTGASLTLNNIVGDTLTGSYLVGATGSGENANDLTVSSITAHNVCDINTNCISSNTLPGTNIANGSEIVIDTTAPQFSSVAPVNAATIDSVTANSDISYTLSETLASGTITITQTAGAIDPNSPHTCALTDTYRQAGAHNNFDTNNCDSGGEHPVVLVDGAYYEFVFNGVDSQNNNANPIQRIGIRYGVDISAPVISNVASSSVTSTSAIITWATNENANSLVDYGSDTSYSLGTMGNQGIFDTAHSVTLTGLQPGTEYYFRVRSADQDGNESVEDNSGSGYTFTTVSSPTISNVGETHTDDSATITYDTSDIAYGFVDYGLTSGYGNVTGDDGQARANHSIDIMALDPDTTYHYRPRIRDIYGNYTYDGADRTFHTNASLAPALQSFGSSTTNGTYGPGSSINITATYSENLAVGSFMDVTLNTGANVSLISINSNTLVGSYVVGATGSGQNASNLAVAVITYQNVCDEDENCNHEIDLPATNIDDSSNIIIDTTAPEFTNVVPANSTIINSVTLNSDISYSLSETLFSGAIMFTRTGGTADSNSPHTCTLQNEDLLQGIHDEFDTANCVEGERALVSGTTYTLSFTGSDVAGNSASAVDRTDVTFDSEALTLDSFTSSTADGTYGPGDSINITATYSENLAVGSTMTITLDTGASLILSTINANTLTGSYIVGATGSSQNSAGLSVVSITSQDACDVGGNCTTETTLPGINISTDSSIVVDTVAPVFSNVTPLNSANIDSVTTNSDISYTLSENIISGTITIARTAGAADGNSPHVCTLTGTALQQGVHNNFDTNDCVGGEIILADGTFYTVSFVAQDAGENISAETEATGVRYSYDIIPPTISAVTASSITSTSAVISWTTNENANSFVDYGTSSAYGWTSGNLNDATTTHSVTLTNLTPGTDYYYRVRSVDGAGNETTDDNSGSSYTFTAISSPTISNVTESHSDDSATITYTTSVNAYGYVDYGLTGSYGQVTGDDSTTRTNHSIQLAGLQPGTTYHYRPRVRDIYGNYTYDGTDRTFTTNTSVAPVLQAFTSTTADDSYGPNATIDLSATYSENLAAGSTITVALNTGANVTLSAISTDRLTGTYVVGALGSGENTNDLAVSSIIYQNACDSDGNCSHSISIPAVNVSTDSDIIIDTVIPVFSAIAPNSFTTINSVTTSSDISYTLSEALDSGTITVTRTGGVADDDAPHTCTLVGAALAAGVHANFDTTNCAEGLPILVNGAIYTFSFAGQDEAGNSAALVDRTAVTYNDQALTLDSFTTTTVDGTYGPGSSINVTATYSEDLAAGSTLSVMLGTGAPVNLDTVSNDTLTGTYVVGATGSGENTIDLAVSSIVSHNACDIGGNCTTSTSLPATNISDGSVIVVDTTAPDFLNVQPQNSQTIDSLTLLSDISYTLSENLLSGTITITRTAGSADGNSPHVCTLTGTALQQGVHNYFDTNNCVGGEIILVDDAYYNVTFDGSDNGGNAANQIQRTGVRYRSDIIPPTISAVTASSITSTSAVISWTTNENANSFVDYGTSSAYGWTSGNLNDATTTHSVTLTNLTPGTDYYYRVRSVDGAGNETIDDNSGGSYSFTTVSSPTISNVGETHTDDSATITYTTSVNAYGYVDYGLTGSYGQVTGDDSTTRTNHSIQLAGLQPGTTYHYRPRVRDIYGNYTYDGTDRTFTTNTSVAPVLQAFTSTTADDSYGPNATIDLSATYSENLAAGSEIIIALNTGAQVTLSNIDTNTLNGTYTVGALGSGENSNDLAVASIVYQNACDIDGNCSHSISIPAVNVSTGSDITIDTTAPVISAVLPTASSNINSVTTESDIAYTLSETLDSGTITVTRTGGAADNDAPHTCTLVGAALAAGVHANFDTTNCAEGVMNLVSGAVYTFSFAGEDETGNVAVVVSQTDVSYFDQALTLDSFTSSTSNGTYGPGSSINLTATYSMNLDAGATVTVIMDNGVSVVLDNILNDTLSGNYVVGATGSGEDSSDIRVTAITNHSACDDSESYCTTSINLPPININTDSTIVIDTTIPDFTNVTPANSSNIDSVTSSSDISYTATEDLSSATIVVTRTSGSADAGSPHTCTLTGTHLQSGAHNNFNTNNCSEGAMTLSADAVYTFVFSGQDTHGNINTGVTRTNILFTLDNSGPIIVFDPDTDLAVTSVSATITWTTDEESNSLVDYGTTAGVYSGTVGNQTEEVTDHSVTITSLSPDTAYFFRIRSADSLFNETIDDNSGADYGFTTHTAPVFSAVEISSISGTSATVTWTTDSSAYSYVDWGSTDSYGNIVGNETSLTASHSIVLSGLTARTTYHFRPRVKDAYGNFAIYESDMTFTTTQSGGGSGGGSGTGADVTAPSVSGASVSSITSTSAILEWKTNEKATGMVKYGLTNKYDQAAGEVLLTEDKADYPTTHTVTMTGLLSNSTYHYSIIAIDAAGNLSVAADKTFTTSELSSISQVKVTNITLTSATITWETGSPTTTELDYGTSASYGQSVNDLAVSNAHKVELTGLLPDNTYHFRIKGLDKADVLNASDDYTFATYANPKLNDYKVENVTDTEATITWVTNTPAESYVDYVNKADAADKGTQGSAEKITEHKVILRALASGAEYEFKIRGTDINLNTFESEPHTFTTQKDTTPPIIAQVSTKSTLITGKEDKVQTIISWYTDEPTTSQVLFSEGMKSNSYQQSSEDINLTTNHIVILTNFKSGVVYRIKVMSKDKNGNVSESSEVTLLTPQQRQSIIQIIMANFEQTFGWMKKMKM